MSHIFHIGIDARFFGSKQGGIGRYVSELVRALSLRNDSVQYTVLLRKGTVVPFTLPDNFRIVYCDVPWYSWKEQIVLPSLYRKLRVDVWHFPHWNVPLFAPRPFVLTFHDAIMFRFPRQEASTHGPIVYWLKTILAYCIAFMALHRARHVAVTSEIVKHDAAKLFFVPKKKMTVIYQAPASIALPVAGDSMVKEPYALYVGSAFPHKNVSRLLQAWEKVRKEIDSTARLVLAGPSHVFYTRLQQKDLPKEGVVFLGEVSDADLARLYCYARLFIFPSLAEGFGIPPLEAMRFGVPVVSSNASCMPEVLGSAVQYMNPLSEDDMADNIVLVWNGKTLREALSEKGRAHVQKFSWDVLAEQMMEIYRGSKKATIEKSKE